MFVAKVPLFVVKMVLVSTALISEVRAAGAACELPKDSVAVRERQLSAESILVKKQVGDSEKTLKELEKSYSRAKGGSIFADIVKGIVSVVGAFIPGVSLLQSWASETGVPFMKKLLSGGSAPRPDSSGSGVVLTLGGHKVYARDASEAAAWIEARIEELEKTGQARGRQLVDTKSNFLTKGDCVKEHECAVGSDELEELHLALARWYSKAQHIKGKSDEWMLAEVQIPFMKLTLRVLKLKNAYFGQLKNVFKEKTAGC